MCLGSAKGETELVRKREKEHAVGVCELCKPVCLCRRAVSRTPPLSASDRGDGRRR